MEMNGINMSGVNMNALKTDNTNGADTAKAEPNMTEINATAEDTSKDTQKPTEATEQENGERGVQKHIVMYIGSSEFTDSTGHKWHKNDEKTYDEAEYAQRKDLHFMVRYGEMKHTAVTM